MKIKIKKVYYCEYCKKHSLLPLTKHEKHCTSNPDRECRLCERTESVEPLIDKYIKQWKPTEYEIFSQQNIEDIKDDVNNCPNCVLTIIKGVGKKYSVDVDFDYQIELKKWWDEKNADVAYNEYD